MKNGTKNRPVRLGVEFECNFNPTGAGLIGYVRDPFHAGEKCYIYRADGGDRVDIGGMTYPINRKEPAKGNDFKLPFTYSFYADVLSP